MKPLYRQIRRIIRVSLQGIVSGGKKIEYIPVKPRLTNESFEDRQIIYRAKPINRHHNIYGTGLVPESEEQTG